MPHTSGPELDDLEPEPPDPEWAAFSAWSDAHPQARGLEPLEEE